MVLGGRRGGRSRDAAITTCAGTAGNKKKVSKPHPKTAVYTTNAAGIAGIAYSVPTEDIGGGGSTGGAGVP